MNGARAVAAAVVLLGLAGTGCAGGTPPAHPHGAASPASVSASASASASVAKACPPVKRPGTRDRAAWPARIVARENPSEQASSQVADPATASVYLLVSTTADPARGPWVLCRISLRNGSARLGQRFPAGDLSLAAGHLWVYGAAGSGSQPAVTEADPVTLERALRIPLPRVPEGAVTAVTAGPAGSVWIGSYRTLLRVNAATGAVLARQSLPAGLAVDNLSVDPSGSSLYVSAAHVVRGGVEGLVMSEYDARSGHLLVRASGGALRYSVAGAQLTAVPGGVWASFRTGMLGFTIHLASTSLRMINPSSPRALLKLPATGIFHWPMYSTTSFSGGALWVANQVGIVACLDPRTAAVRAIEHLPAGKVIDQIGAVSPATRTILALRVSNNDLVQITPPRRCWG